MAERLPTGRVDHLKLTVTDVGRFRDFYTQLLNSDVVGEIGTSTLISNGSVLLGLGPAPDATQAPADDRFSENRVGLDHLSFEMASREELERAVRVFDERGVPHGEIKDLGEDLGICVLMFRDPDNVQLELTSPR